MDIRIRPASAADITCLRELIDVSVRKLQAGDYTPQQIDRGLARVYGVDTQLIADGTYYVAEAPSLGEALITGCGGWSKRKTLYGGDQYASRQDDPLDPRVDAEEYGAVSKPRRRQR
jgi:hypothetical protein